MCNHSDVRGARRKQLFQAEVLALQILRNVIISCGLSAMGTRRKISAKLLSVSVTLNLLLILVPLLTWCHACPVKPNNVVRSTVPAPARLWLIIGLPTVPRTHADYLTPTIEALAIEVANPAVPFQNRVQVVTMSMVAVHPAFERIRTTYHGHPCFRFEYAPANAIGDQSVDGGRYDVGTRNVPGYRVRRQTRHFAVLLNHVANESDYFLTMEDDFIACPSILPTIAHIIYKAHHWVGDWIAIRVSYGLAGVLLRGKDLSALAAHVASRRWARPPDHLLVEWFAGETASSNAYRGQRRNMAFRYNVLDHIGEVSTLRPELSPSYPHCFMALSSPVLFEVEAFNEAECPNEDLWPCAPIPVHSSHIGLDGANASIEIVRNTPLPRIAFGGGRKETHDQSRRYLGKPIAARRRRMHRTS